MITAFSMLPSISQSAYSTFLTDPLRANGNLTEQDNYNVNMPFHVGLMSHLFSLYVLLSGIDVSNDKDTGSVRSSPDAGSASVAASQQHVSRTSTNLAGPSAGVSGVQYNPGTSNAPNTNPSLTHTRQQQASHEVSYQ